MLYFAGYDNGGDLFKREEIEAGTDQVIWAATWATRSHRIGPRIVHFRGNIVEAMVAYAEAGLGGQWWRSRTCRASSRSAQIA